MWEASAVAKAAMETGVAQQPVNLAEYREQLEKRLGKAHELMRLMIHKAQGKPQTGGLHGRRGTEDPAGVPYAAGREDCDAGPAGPQQ